MLSRIRAAAAQAREKGALQTIETTQETITSNPAFSLRILSNISAKKAAANNRDPTGTAPEPTFNPFLPYDASMYVQHLPPDHVLLLNKFNVVSDHTLIITERYEEQNSLLTASDFRAVWKCLTEIPGIVFYNAGRIAGASQRHKHLQHIAVIEEDDKPPFEEILSKNAVDGVVQAANLGYIHGIVGMRDVCKIAENDGIQAGEICMQRYTEILRMLESRVEGLNDVEDMESGDRQPFAYNLVASRNWLLVVPRRKECFQDISINSLGFVGCLLVKNSEQAQLVRDVGGMRVLREVGFQVDE